MKTLLRCKTENFIFFRIRNDNFAAFWADTAHGKLHIQLFGLLTDRIIANTQGNECAAVDGDIAVSVNAAFRALFIGHCDNGSAIDSQKAIGINTISFGAQTGVDGQISADNSGDRNTVFIGIDTVILRCDGNIAAVYRQMQLGVQPLVFSIDDQRTFAIDVHGHFAVKGTVIFMQLVSCSFFINACYIRAVYNIF